jgi:crotonobetainyl-CoA:carnitine CoA-transferase CaiB-like acyl-CoA transferase
LGADVLKVERPGKGDDTRGWGPPFVEGKSAAYFYAANRNKSALAIDFGTDAGSDLIRRLADVSDVLIENFRPGTLARYGLDYPSLRARNDRLIYCSITGFGQTGPYSQRGGYDLLVQGMSGFMSVTGHADGEPGGGPMKAGVPIADLFTGVYAATSILAALNYRHASGQGQHIDAALLDTQMAVMANQAAAFLASGMAAARVGNGHPTVVPYRDFPTQDGRVLIALGTDTQFARLCLLLGLPALAEDRDLCTNASRHARRDELEAAIGTATAAWSTADLTAALEREGLPGGPINTLRDAFDDPHVRSREIVRQNQDGRGIPLVRYPHLFSETPPMIRQQPPAIGEHTADVLERLLGLSAEDIAGLKRSGVIAVQKE